MQATVNISLEELQSLLKAKEAAEQEASQLREKIKRQVIAASDQMLLGAVRAGIEIMRFAVSQLPPESTKGWPIEALQLIATRLPLLPDASIDDSELAVTIDSFARECDVFEKRRQGLST